MAELDFIRLATNGCAVDGRSGSFTILESGLTRHDLSRNADNEECKQDVLVGSTRNHTVPNTQQISAWFCCVRANVSLAGGEAAMALETSRQPGRFSLHVMGESPFAHSHCTSG